MNSAPKLYRNTYTSLCRDHRTYWQEFGVSFIGSGVSIYFVQCVGMTQLENSWADVILDNFIKHIRLIQGKSSP
jgi:hypothetical protein